MCLLLRKLLELCETFNHFLYFGNHYKLWSDVANVGSIYRRKCCHNIQIAKSFLHAKITFSLQKLGGISVTDLTSPNRKDVLKWLPVSPSTGILSSPFASIASLAYFYTVLQEEKKHIKNIVSFFPAFLIATYPFRIIALNRIPVTWNNTQGKLLLLKPMVIFVWIN